MSISSPELPAMFRGNEEKLSPEEQRRKHHKKAFNLISTIVEQKGKAIKGTDCTVTEPRPVGNGIAVMLKRTDRPSESGGLELVKLEVLKQEGDASPELMATLYDPSEGPEIAYEAPMNMSERLQSDEWLVSYLQSEPVNG
jgi:hypothetical protein